MDDSVSVEFRPFSRKVTVPSGTSLAHAMRAAGIEPDFPCGGRGRCGKCAVKFVSGFGPAGAREEDVLSAADTMAGVRLACQVVVKHDCVVELSSGRSWDFKTGLMQGVGGETIAGEVTALNPFVRKSHVNAGRPTLQDPRSDWERVAGTANFGGRDEPVPVQLLRQLPKLLRDANFDVTLVRHHGGNWSIEAGDTSSVLYGMAVDIGTTTVVGYLCDLISGKQVAVASAKNPQVAHGADVVSRITYAMQEKDGLAELQAGIAGAVNGIIKETTEKAGIRSEDVYCLTVVGNTCMHHLFLGIDPTHVGLYPYVPVVTGPVVADANELGIEMNRAGKVFVLPNIAGFVGADTVGMILALGLDKRPGVTLAVDIGTNGEIVLAKDGKMLACSAAAGPAFEGAQISSGMRAAAGAIDHVWSGGAIPVAKSVAGLIEYSVVGGGKPEGICGSGLLDAVATLLCAGVISAKGVILPVGGTIEHNGSRAYVLVDEAGSASGKPILLTQKDVRELQLAKGAILTGIKALLRRMEIGVEQVDEVLLAGAFGNYLDPASAFRIGLFPKEMAGKVKQVGNAAGAGALAALRSKDEYLRAAKMAASVEYVELAAMPDFAKVFAASLDLR